MTFGRALRELWYLDPDTTYLNHGTVGAPPRAVVAEQMRLMEAIERHPARFMLRELADPERDRPHQRSRLRLAADAVAPFVGISDGDDLLFVDNITAGANAVLRSFPFEPDDEIVVTSLGYGGIVNAARFAARDRGCTIRTIELPRPGAPAGAFVDAIADGLSERTRVVVVDHVTASTALVLPLAAIAAVCHAHGALVLADGAHVPGNINLDIPALGVDWYTANLHKWAWTPRSSGILWAAPEQRGHLHPAVISWGLDHGLAEEFDLLGTRDPTAHLCAPFAIDLLESYGEGAVMAYNHDLAWWAAHHLADRWDVDFATPESMIGSMVTVRLPTSLTTADRTAGELQAALDEAAIEIPVFAVGDGFEARISAQVYCDRDDIDRLATAVLNLC